MTTQSSLELNPSGSQGYQLVYSGTSSVVVHTKRPSTAKSSRPIHVAVSGEMKDVVTRMDQRYFFDIF